MWQHQRMLRISSGQAVMIREWLEAHFDRAGQGNQERTRVDVRHLDGEWRSMGQILMMRADWPGAATMSPIESATSPPRGLFLIRRYLIADEDGQAPRADGRTEAKAIRLVRVLARLEAERDAGEFGYHPQNALVRRQLSGARLDAQPTSLP